MLLTFGGIDALQCFFAHLCFVFILQISTSSHSNGTTQGAWGVSVCRNADRALHGPAGDGERQDKVVHQAVGHETHFRVALTTATLTDVANAIDESFQRSTICGRHFIRGKSQHISKVEGGVPVRVVSEEHSHAQSRKPTDVASGLFLDAPEVIVGGGLDTTRDEAVRVRGAAAGVHHGVHAGARHVAAHGQIDQRVGVEYLCFLIVQALPQSRGTVGFKVVEPSPGFYGIFADAHSETVLGVIECVVTSLR
mmetsp:Transcript_21115/g.39439  ORF Transcript_21115/g.39439 Transcript_21115/m.39439 type:complete len:252 (+) Transcript_21115:1913-2668(+)